MHIRILPSKPTARQTKDLIDRRARFRKQFAKFEADSPIDFSLLTEIENDSSEDEQEEDYHQSSSEDEDFETDEEVVDDEIQLDLEAAEKMKILLPSRFDPQGLKNAGFEELLLTEKELREGQMNDSIRLVRHSLGDKAWLLRKRLRNAKGTKAKGQVRKSVAAKTRDVQKHISAYNRGRKALLRMGFGEEWKPITREDLRLSADISEANRVGQNTEKLPWFWRIEEGPAAGSVDIDSSKQMEECKYHSVLKAVLITSSLPSQLA
jgi:hypothetical protein